MVLELCYYHFNKITAFLNEMILYYRLFFVFLLNCLTNLSFCQNYKPTIGQLVAYDDTFYKLVSKNAQIEILVTGLAWGEGPVWVKNENYLLFSDVPKNTINQYSFQNGFKQFLKPSGYTGQGNYSNEPGSNGLILNKNGKLVSCEHGDRRISAMDLNTKLKITLANNYKGKKFNSPNDIVQSKDGSYYFTDPPYGLPNWGQEPCLTKELSFNGLFRISKGKVILLDSTFQKPNGLAFSPDFKKLYVAQSDPIAPYIYVFDVNKKGEISNKKIFFNGNNLLKQNLKGLPDGLKVDIQGNLFATGPGGVLVINPLGKLLGRIETTVATANCTFGEDGTVLFITANDYLLKIPTLTKGFGF